MKLHFWGTRGSLPYSVRPEQVKKKIEMALTEAVEYGLNNTDDVGDFIENNLSFDIRASYGCNTSCVELRWGPEFIICDAGSGLRDLGDYVMTSGLKPPQTFHIFQSHLHWDHIQGFPFFTPAYIPGNTIHIYGYHDQLEAAFVNQQMPPYFPVPLSAMSADIHFHVLDVSQTRNIAGVQVHGIKQVHPFDSYGYCFEKDGRKVVYSTDSEHQEESEKEDYAFIDFARNADVLVFDAQYRLVDHFITRRTWGHSSNIVAVELAVRADVKQLCLFHNEHTVDDHQLEKFLEETRTYLGIYTKGTSYMQIHLAHDGLEIDLSE